MNSTDWPLHCIADSMIHAGGSYSEVFGSIQIGSIFIFKGGRSAGWFLSDYILTSARTEYFQPWITNSVLRMEYSIEDWKEPWSKRLFRARVGYWIHLRGMRMHKMEGRTSEEQEKLKWSVVTWQSYIYIALFYPRGATMFFGWIALEAKYSCFIWVGRYNIAWE